MSTARSTGCGAAASKAGGRRGRASEPTSSTSRIPTGISSASARPGRCTRSRALSKPFLLVNPRSGAERPTAEELVAEAESVGVETRAPGSEDDLAGLAHEAADRGPGPLATAARLLAGGRGPPGGASRAGGPRGEQRLPDDVDGRPGRAHP